MSRGGRHRVESGCHGFESYPSARLSGPTVHRLLDKPAVTADPADTKVVAAVASGADRRLRLRRGGGHGAGGTGSGTAPHIGYVYPAGGRQGTTFQVTVGGQHLAGVSRAFVSGGGVQATVVEYVKPTTQRRGRPTETATAAGTAKNR